MLTVFSVVSLIQTVSPAGAILVKWYSKCSWTVFTKFNIDNIHTGHLTGRDLLQYSCLSHLYCLWGACFSLSYCSHQLNAFFTQYSTQLLSMERGLTIQRNIALWNKLISKRVWSWWMRFIKCVEDSLTSNWHFVTCSLAFFPPCPCYWQNTHTWMCGAASLLHV